MGVVHRVAGCVGLELHKMTTTKKGISARVMLAWPNE